VPPAPDLLQRQDPRLSATLEVSSRGRYDGPHGSARFVAVRVAGTPWRLVVSAPESQVYLAVAGARTIVPWLVFAGLVAAVGAALVLQIRLAQSRSKQLEQIGLLSLTDPLTGLYNRRGYELLANQILKEASREARVATIMFFDMDGLKKINDGLGHQAGNEAIVAAADLLRSTFRDSDVVARIGGDEFCVVGTLPGPPPDGSAQLARLHDAIEMYNEREKAAFQLALSGGVATYDPRHPRPLEQLEAEADERMYAEKRASKSLR
jgi:diguanylate cyclase (GGDEF)-like protein